MNKWYYTGDISVLEYGGLWIRALDAHRFHVVELTNMDEACGSDNDGHPKYDVQLGEVDLREINRDKVLSFYGAVDAVCDLYVAEAAFRYGQYAPLDSESTNNGWAGIRNMKRRSRELEVDSEAYEAAMEQPVNRLGSTAREFMRGDLEAGIRRGVALGDECSLLMAKIYQNCGGQTLGGEVIDLSDLDIQ